MFVSCSNRVKKTGRCRCVGWIRQRVVVSSAVFRRTGLTPERNAELGDKCEFTLHLPKDYRTREILAFFGRIKRAVGERVTIGAWSSGFQTDGRAVSVEVEFGKQAAVCRTDPGYAYAAHRAALRMLGFESERRIFRAPVRQRFG